MNIRNPVVLANNKGPQLARHYLVRLAGNYQILKFSFGCFLLAGLTVACNSADHLTRPAQPVDGVSGEASLPSGERSKVDEQIYRGPLPDPLEQVDARLVRRDINPLPPGAFLKFQLINRGRHPRINYRWLLYEDGRWFISGHSGNEENAGIPVDTELPATPNRQFSAEFVNRVTEQLKEAAFLTQHPYQAHIYAEDGTYYVVTARVNGENHEVIYVNVSTPLTEFLGAISTQIE